jgi:tRNA(Ile)-lysidine synthase
MTSSPSVERIRDTVRRYAGEHGLLPPGSVIVAVSGGTDSTALLLLLTDLAPELGIVLHAAYFDHRIRRTGAEDAQFVSDLAAKVGATIRIGRADRVPKSEDEARQARYEFLRRAASERNATVVATGHTRDDQAETVLLHLTRGSGIGGLSAMRPLREGIARPLLCIGRAETAAVCGAAGVAPREDPTNRSLRYARNRIRRKVLPELGAINPQVTEALARLADAAADVVASHRSRATAALSEATRDGAIHLDSLGPDAAVREEALAIAWQRATGHVLTGRHREAVGAQASRGDGRAALDLPGGRLVREHRLVRIEPHAATGPVL